MLYKHSTNRTSSPALTMSFVLVCHLGLQMTLSCHVSFLWPGPAAQTFLILMIWAELKDILFPKIGLG